jgi:hypothetical protein
MEMRRIIMKGKRHDLGFGLVQTGPSAQLDTRFR